LFLKVEFFVFWRLKKRVRFEFSFSFRFEKLGNRRYEAYEAEADERGSRGGEAKQREREREREREKESEKNEEQRKKNPKLTRRDDAVGLALPEGDLALGLDDDVHGLARGLGADDALDGLDLGLGERGGSGREEEKRSKRREEERVRVKSKKNRSSPARRLSEKKGKKLHDHFTLNGALLLKVLRGISPFSSSRGTFWRTTWGGKGDLESGGEDGGRGVSEEKKEIVAEKNFRRCRHVEKKKKFPRSFKRRFDRFRSLIKQSNDART